MKRRFSDEPIIGMIREHEAGAKASDLCRKYGISDATFYKYKARFGGMTVSDAKKLRGLEEENARLKRLLADASSWKRRNRHWKARLRRSWGPPCNSHPMMRSTPCYSSSVRQPIRSNRRLLPRCLPLPS